MEPLTSGCNANVPGRADIGSYNSWYSLDMKWSQNAHVLKACSPALAVLGDFKRWSLVGGNEVTGGVPPEGMAQCW
jgi:hypothetical protein